MIPIAINGFGRIGRMILRAYLERHMENFPFEIVLLNDLAPPATAAHLFKYDSCHGTWPGDVFIEEKGAEKYIKVGTHTFRYLQQAQPAAIPYRDFNIELVMESTGRFTTRSTALQHREGGARKILISAPAEEEDLTVVYGVNHTALKAHHEVVSNASCTTNCLAPIVHLLDQAFGFEQGYMSTTHAYTADQCLIDSAHKDLHRARAAAVSMIPTSTGAAKAVGRVLPHLKGRLDGSAIRVPVPVVSMIDLKFTTRQPMTGEDINQLMKEAHQNSMHGIVGYNDVPLVSIDFKHRPESALFDATQTQIVTPHFGRVVAWYDNEWGFANRMLDVAAYWISQK